MNEGMTVVIEEERQPGLEESDILPLKHDERTADNPMGTVLNFLGLATMLELTSSTLEMVGGLDGGLDIPAGEMPTAPGMDMDFSYETLMPPTTPGGMGV